MLELQGHLRFLLSGLNVDGQPEAVGNPSRVSVVDTSAEEEGSTSKADMSSEQACTAKYVSTANERACSAKYNNNSEEQIS